MWKLQGRIQEGNKITDINEGLPDDLWGDKEGWLLSVLEEVLQCIVNQSVGEGNEESERDRVRARAMILLSILQVNYDQLLKISKLVCYNNAMKI